jgi:ParB-like chromosome segregation protein Spo0J
VNIAVFLFQKETKKSEKCSTWNISEWRRNNSMKLKVDYIPIEQLKVYEKNAKIHTPEQIEQIKNSIREFGMNDPIGIWGKDNLIVEGHGRLQACKELGMKEVPVIRLDDLTDEQRRAYTLVHNQTTMNTGFNMDILTEELDNIDIDMSELGFPDNEEVNLDDFFTEAEESKKEEKETDTITCPYCHKQFIKE